MGAAHVPDDAQGKVALEALNCATMLNGLQLVKIGDKTATRDKHIYDKNPR